MRILNVTAQKPDSTGSGTYLTELVKGFDFMGHTQGVVAGVYKEDTISLPEHVKFFPVYFGGEKLPFPIVGMSDEMPYKSTRYGEMTEEMTGQFEQAFYETLKSAVDELKPDLILCHHLYLLTACIREWFPEYKVSAVCHGTDLRQLKKTPLKREQIKQANARLTMAYALHKSQQIEIMELFHLPEEKVKVIGSGFNDEIFYADEKVQKEKPETIIYAGKLSEKKGLYSLLRALNQVDAGKSLQIQLAGGYGNEAEYAKIKELAEQCRYPVTFLGKLSQKELSEKFRKSSLFVLPSFFEGLPLVLLEALACHTKVVATDLPGVKHWLDTNLPNHGVRFVTPPLLQNTDEPVEAELPGYEARLADSIEEMLKKENSFSDAIGNLSWKGICKKILEDC